MGPNPQTTCIGSQKSREVGCSVGLKPGRRDSGGELEMQMQISKEGDRYLRTMLVCRRALYSRSVWTGTVICGDGDCDLPSAEGKMPRNERLLRWRESWRYCCIGCGVSGEVYEPLRSGATKRQCAVASSWRSSLVSDLLARNVSREKLRKTGRKKKSLQGKKKKGAYKKEERWYPNNRELKPAEIR